jgi:UDP-N-acetylglucosamine 2-epimerase (non-hydrolysing)
MPEEHNRTMVDHASEYLFAPTEHARMNLLNERVHGKMWVTGNTVIDAVKQHLPKLHRSSATGYRLIQGQPPHGCV